jgi:hypothetical protein
MTDVPRRTATNRTSAQYYGIEVERSYLLVAKIQKLVEFDTTVRECAERPLFLEVSGDLGVGDFVISLQGNSSASFLNTSIRI